MISNKIVFVLGNILVKNDSLPLLILPDLIKQFPHITFLTFDPTEEFTETKTDNLVILDTIINITTVSVFDEHTKWTRSPNFTVHDYDLELSLGLLKKLGKIKKYTIIGIPPKGNREIIYHEVVLHLKTILF